MSAITVVQAPLPYVAARKPAAAVLSRAERMLFGFMVATAIASILSAAMRQQAVDWVDFCLASGSAWN